MAAGPAGGQCKPRAGSRSCQTSGSERNNCQRPTTQEGRPGAGQVPSAPRAPGCGRLPGRNRARGAPGAADRASPRRRLPQPNPTEIASLPGGCPRDSVCAGRRAAGLTFLAPQGRTGGGPAAGEPGGSLGPKAMGLPGRCPQSIARGIDPGPFDTGRAPIAARASKTGRCARIRRFVVRGQRAPRGFSAGGSARRGSSSAAPERGSRSRPAILWSA